MQLTIDKLVEVYEGDETKRNITTLLDQHQLNRLGYLSNKRADQKAYYDINKRVISGDYKSDFSFERCRGKCLIPVIK